MWSGENTRGERPKSALYLRLKKRKTFFEKKTFLKKKFFRKMSHSAEKCKGDPFGFITIH